MSAAGAAAAGAAGVLCLAVRERARSRAVQLREAEARLEAVRRGPPGDLPDAKLYSARLAKLGEPFHPSSSQTYLVPEGEQTDAWKRTNLDYGPKIDVLNRGKSKLVIVLVGKPGRAKTYVAHKLTRYLCWVRYAARVFTYSAIREELYGRYQAPEFFASTNAGGMAKRDAVCRRALQLCTKYLESGGEVGVLDGTNTSRKRRDFIRRTLNAGCPSSNVELLWVECICEDPELIAASLRQRVDAPEYAANARFSSEAERMADFAKRCAQYDGYESLQKGEGQRIAVYDFGRRVTLGDIAGYLPTRIVSFLLNLNAMPKRVFLTRHGESQNNVKELIGGDPGLSPHGQQYAAKLAAFIKAHDAAHVGGPGKMQVWSSTMRRTLETSSCLAASMSPPREVIKWRCLQEIDVGICDGLTYKQVEQRWPEEFAARAKDKLRYRYPRGESYLDIIDRLEPVIFELERQRDPVVVVAHQAVLRCLYSYFGNLEPHSVPFLKIPLHEVIEIIPRAYGCSEQRHALMPVDKRSEVSQGGVAPVAGSPPSPAKGR